MLSGAVVLYNGPDPNNSNNILTIYGFYLGSTAYFKPLATVSGYLNLWIDWDGNSNWDDSTSHIDHVIIDEPIVSGPNYTITGFTVPIDATLGWTYARYRFSTKSGLDYVGPSANGEVEDYIYKILPPFDFGDAPDSYSTLAVNDGAKHMIGTTYLGISVDADHDGQPDSLALGDDNDENNDDDGILFLDSLISKNPVRVQVTAATPIGVPGYLNAWIDFNRDGTWDDSTEQIFTDLILYNGIDTLTFNVPDSSTNGLSFARFRFTDGPGYNFNDSSLFLNPRYGIGEIEDYSINISGGITGIQNYDNLIPKIFSLSQNYPNPFNPSTTISYQIPVPGKVTLKIYDILGREVTTLVNKEQKAGNYKVNFDASRLASGVYFYRITAGQFVSVKKMILMK